MRDVIFEISLFTANAKAFSTIQILAIPIINDLNISQYLVIGVGNL